MKFLTHGCFDVLHSGHRGFVNKLIGIFGDDLIIGTWENQRINQRKGSDRPLFDLSWRLQDIRNSFPNHQSLALSQQEWETGTVKGFNSSNLTIISLRPPEGLTEEYRQKTFTTRLINNGFNILYIDDSTSDHPFHTSDIPKYLAKEESLSKCLTKRVGAVLVRDGNIITSGHNLGAAEDCPRCKHNQQQLTGSKPPCHELHAEEVVLKQAQPGDDLFISYAPCKKCHTLIDEAGIRRVVFFKDQWSGLVNWPDNFRLAGSTLG